MTQISAYLTFNGNCREALTFYKECFDADLNLQTVEGSPMEDQCPPGMKHLILHAILIKDDFILMATDMVEPEGFIKGNNISLSVMCGSEKEINNYFSKFSVGGEILDPLREQFWGAIFGCVVDKFGIRWMFNFEKNEPIIQTDI